MNRYNVVVFVNRVVCVWEGNFRPICRSVGRRNLPIKASNANDLHNDNVLLKN